MELSLSQSAVAGGRLRAVVAANSFARPSVVAANSFARPPVSTARLTSRRRRAFSYLELLIAAVILSLAAVGAVATWGISSRAAANKRVTEMGVYVGTSELERLKALKYMGLADGSGVSYYDKYGRYLGAAATAGFYRAEFTVATMVNRDGRVNAEDLRQVTITVTNANDTRDYGTFRSLLAFGGI